MNAPLEDAAASLFVYGTLQDRELLAAVAGVDPWATRRPPVPATAPDLLAVAAPGDGPGADYPVLRKAPGRAAPGLAIAGLGLVAWARLRAYEGAAYQVGEIAVRTAEGPLRPMRAFLPCDGAAEAESASLEAGSLEAGSLKAWSLKAWADRSAPAQRKAAEALGRVFSAMAAQGGGPELDARLDAAAALWPDLIGEAAAALALPGPIARRRGPPFDRRAVREIERARPYDGYFKVDRFVLRHRLMGRPAEWAAPIERAVFRMGAAVVLLPYDPARDRVLLIEQFRAGPWAAEDPQPWTIEAIAGRIEASTLARAGPREAAEETARREAAEEAGLDVGRIARIFEGYSSPGAVDELLTLYVAEADLGDEQGGAGFGLAEEGEDIRAVTLGLEAALESLAAGEIRNGPAAHALLWLARNAERLRAEWR